MNSSASTPSTDSKKIGSGSSHSDDSEVVCNACGFEASFVPEGMLVCERCRQVQYCSVHCLQWDWKSGGHAKVCIDVREEQGSESSTGASGGEATMMSMEVGQAFQPSVSEGSSGNKGEITKAPAVAAGAAARTATVPSSDEAGHQSTAEASSQSSLGSFLQHATSPPQKSKNTVQPTPVSPGAGEEEESFHIDSVQESEPGSLLKAIQEEDSSFSAPAVEGSWRSRDPYKVVEATAPNRLSSTTPTKRPVGSPSSQSPKRSKDEAVAQPNPSQSLKTFRDVYEAGASPQPGTDLKSFRDAYTSDQITQTKSEGLASLQSPDISEVNEEAGGTSQNTETLRKSINTALRDYERVYGQEAAQAAYLQLTQSISSETGTAVKSASESEDVSMSDTGKGVDVASSKDRAVIDSEVAPSLTTSKSRFAKYHGKESEVPNEKTEEKAVSNDKSRSSSTGASRFAKYRGQKSEDTREKTEENVVSSDKTGSSSSGASRFSKYREKDVSETTEEKAADSGKMGSASTGATGWFTRYRRSNAPTSAAEPQAPAVETPPASSRFGKYRQSASSSSGPSPLENVAEPELVEEEGAQPSVTAQSRFARYRQPAGATTEDPTAQNTSETKDMKQPPSVEQQSDSPTDTPPVIEKETNKATAASSSSMFAKYRNRSGSSQSTSNIPVAAAAVSSDISPPLSSDTAKSTPVDDGQATASSRFSRYRNTSASDTVEDRTLVSQTQQSVQVSSAAESSEKDSNDPVVSTAEVPSSASLGGLGSRFARYRQYFTGTSQKESEVPATSTPTSDGENAMNVDEEEQLSSTEQKYSADPAEANAEAGQSRFSRYRSASSVIKAEETGISSNSFSTSTNKSPQAEPTGGQVATELSVSDTVKKEVSSSRFNKYRAPVSNEPVLESSDGLARPSPPVITSEATGSRPTSNLVESGSQSASRFSRYRKPALANPAAPSDEGRVEDAGNSNEEDDREGVPTAATSVAARYVKYRSGLSQNTSGQQAKVPSEEGNLEPVGESEGNKPGKYSKYRSSLQSTEAKPWSKDLPSAGSAAVVGSILTESSSSAVPAPPHASSKISLTSEGTRVTTEETALSLETAKEGQQHPIPSAEKEKTEENIEGATSLPAATIAKRDEPAQNRGIFSRFSRYRVSRSKGQESESNANNGAEVLPDSPARDSLAASAVVSPSPPSLKQSEAKAEVSNHSSKSGSDESSVGEETAEDIKEKLSKYLSKGKPPSQVVDSQKQAQAVRQSVQEKKTTIAANHSQAIAASIAKDVSDSTLFKAQKVRADTTPIAKARKEPSPDSSSVPVAKAQSPSHGASASEILQIQKQKVVEAKNTVFMHGQMPTLPPPVRKDSEGDDVEAPSTPPTGPKPKERETTSTSSEPADLGGLRRTLAIACGVFGMLALSLGIGLGLQRNQNGERAAEIATEAPTNPPVFDISPTVAPVPPIAATPRPTPSPSGLLITPSMLPVSIPETEAPQVATPTSGIALPTTEPIAVTESPVSVLTASPTIISPQPSNDPSSILLEPTALPVATTLAPIEPPTQAPQQLTLTPIAAPTQSPVEPTLLPVAATLAPVESTLPPVVVTSSPTGFQENILGILSLASFDSGESLRVAGTPQNRAFNWIVADPNLMTYDESQIVQRHTMATFYYSTDGDEWTINGGWLSDVNECEWFSRSSRIPSCDDSGSMTNLDLGFNEVSGSLPPEIGLLTQLTRVELSGGTARRISGSLPSQLGLLSNIQSFDIFGNDISGKIPPELGSWSSIELLNLGFNSLTGTIPSSLGSMLMLTDLNFALNFLTGEIPSSFGQLVGLERLSVNNNNLSGALPDSIGELVNLREMNLSNNGFSMLPLSLAALGSLETLRMGNNGLSGTLISSIGLLVSLRTLDVNMNKLSGSIPTEIGNLINVRSLNLSSNNLAGQIPEELGNLDRMLTLLLQSNQLSGTIPDSFGQLSRVTTVRVDDNNISGVLSDVVCDAFSVSLPTFHLDCGGSSPEIVCPPGTCCTYCCNDNTGCECVYTGSSFEFLC